jgi:hypothetical protein
LADIQIAIPPSQIALVISAISALLASGITILISSFLSDIPAQDREWMTIPIKDEESSQRFYPQHGVVPL